MRPDSSLHEANQLIAAGRGNEAVALLEANRDDPACAVRLRELYLGERRREQAMDVCRDMAGGYDAEAHVSRSVIALLQDDPERALREVRLALDVEPGLATAHNHLGRALHNSNQSLQAVSALRKAVQLRDEYPEAWANLGLVLRATGALDQAIKAYRRALELAPGFIAAELNLGISLLVAERVDEALFCLEAVLKRDPQNQEALVNTGLALHLLGRMDEARRHFEHAIRLDQLDPLAWCYLGILLHESHQPEQALEALQRAVALDPMEVQAWVEMAAVHEHAGRLDDAAAALERALHAEPSDAAALLELARLRRREDRLDEALELLRRLSSRPLPTRLAHQYCFEAGIALDRAGRHAEAFEAYQQGNRLQAASVRRRSIDPQAFERSCSALEKWLQAGAPGARPQDSDPRDDLGADLCFLVGFQRSGTTLLETMLDAHPAIASMDERPTLEQVIHALRAGPQGYPGALEKLDGAVLARLRQLYRAEAQRHLGGREAALIVDKLPMRFMHAGLIHRLFPGARILFALRHPCDVVLSNFMQDFAPNEFSIHLDTVQDCAAMYVRTMSLWRRMEQLLPLNLQYTRYEALVADPEAELAAVCAFLGIEPVAAMFDAAARREGRAPVRTPSYHQVAEPLYQRAAGRWVNYRVQLAPCLETLRPFAEHLGYGLEA
jgi:tetratricopeptide (TPR) repeat protein